MKQKTPNDITDYLPHIHKGLSERNTEEHKYAQRVFWDPEGQGQNSMNAKYQNLIACDHCLNLI